MPEIQFVLETGTGEESKQTRKTIRRHVMLGKNENRAPRNPKQPSLRGASVFRAVRSPNVSSRAITPAVPRQIASSISLWSFADYVDPSTMAETLQFCSSTHEYMYILSPYIHFDLQGAMAMCREALGADKLYMNVFVFSAQEYMNLMFRRATSLSRAGSNNASLHHYGRTIGLLHQAVTDAVQQQSEMSESSIMAVCQLVFHALFDENLENASIHMLGLRRLVDTKHQGINFFRRRPNAMEVLRCDISTSLATGQAHLFFRDPKFEPLPPLALGDKRENPSHPAPFFAQVELVPIWSALHNFSAMINDCAARRSRISDADMLETMESVMYRLLAPSTTFDLRGEAARLAMLSFGTTVFLHWKQLWLPLPRLQSEFYDKIERLVDSPSAWTDPAAILWLIRIYAVTFWPFVEADKLKALRWMQDLARQGGYLSWQGYEQRMQVFLWIDVLFSDKVRHLFDRAMSLGAE